MRETVTTIRVHIVTTNLGNVHHIRRCRVELYAIVCFVCYICDIPCVYQALYFSTITFHGIITEVNTACRLLFCSQ